MPHISAHQRAVLRALGAAHRVEIDLHGSVVITARGAGGNHYGPGP